MKMQKITQSLQSRQVKFTVSAVDLNIGYEQVIENKSGDG